MRDDPFAIVTPPPGVQPAPVLVHVPHAGTAIPPADRAPFTLPAADLARELARSTDHATDRLWLPARELGATLLVDRVSRLVCDVERFVDDRDEAWNAARGRGAVYTRTEDGRPLRPGLAEAQRRDLLARFHAPWHAALADLADAMLARWDVCWLVDAHSFPHEPLGCEIDPVPGARPQIDLGWDDQHTPPEVRGPLVALWRSHGFTVTEQRPFAGSMVPARHLGRDLRLRTVMVEIDRAVYLDEPALLDTAPAQVEAALAAEGPGLAEGPGAGMADAPGHPGAVGPQLLDPTAHLRPGGVTRLAAGITEMVRWLAMRPADAAPHDP